jgi:calcineurin-like phosphoesterase family protein
MGEPIDRRKFLRIAGASIGFGALYQVAPGWASQRAARDTARRLARANGEAVTPFSFVQLSDAHVGFQGPPNPTGTRGFEHAVEVINRLPVQPELILFTGDLTHDTEDAGEHQRRMRQFLRIAGGLHVKEQHAVPGEHDAGLDGGALFRELIGETSYAFDHRGVHFVALDNVSRGKPEVGQERIAWLRDDLARYPRTAPIVVFTHRPLFDLKPEWEWFTRDGDAVMKVLSGHENVTVLYGHIHREHVREQPGCRHLAARSLIFAFPDPDGGGEKKPLPFDPQRPFRNLGARVVRAAPGAPPGTAALGVEEVELTLRERGGTEGFQQLLRPSTLEG